MADWLHIENSRKAINLDRVLWVTWDRCDHIEIVFDRPELPSHNAHGKGAVDQLVVALKAKGIQLVPPAG